MKAIPCALLLLIFVCWGVNGRQQVHFKPEERENPRQIKRDLPDGAPIQLEVCDGSFHQQWEIQTLATDKTIRLVNDSKCIDIEGYGTTDGSVIWLYSCHTSDTDPAHQNQEFTFTNGQLISTMSGLCLQAFTYVGTQIQLWTCNGKTNQQWVYSNTDQSLRNTASGLCMDAGSPIARPCDETPESGFPYCNYKLPLAQRVADLVSRIPDDEKVGLFGNTAAGVGSLSIPPYQWWSEALHGVAGSPGVSFSGDTPVATSFPQVCTTGATFDTDLYTSIGTAISTEARAFNNAGHAGLTFWAPNLNIFRDPRWGRGQETPGEDPYLTSEYVRHFVSAMQVGPEDPTRLKVSSCCKHFAAYSLEDWDGMDRFHFDAIVSQQDLADTYFPAFATCTSPDGGGASGVMCSYNAVNGIPSCADDYLLTKMARQTWGFDGYVTGDCGAVEDVQTTHHYTSTTDETCSAVLTAGTDIDCGDYLPTNLQQAINDGAVNMSVVNTALSHLFAVQIRLGLFDPLAVQPYAQINVTAINTPEHQQLALRAALEGIVLLSNKNNNTLPLKSGGTVAVIGPNAQATTTMQGNYYGNAPYLISPVAGISKYATVNYQQGCDMADNNTGGFDAACAAAKSSSATILVVGLDQSQESEGHDRTSIAFPGVQSSLISQMAVCSSGPVIVVVMSGGPVDLTQVKANANVDAILWVGYPGQSGGTALASILFGDVSPSGRLPSTIYVADYVNEVSMEDMGMRPNASNGNPGRSYRFYTGTPVFSFGDGLSYTSFSYQWTNNTALTIPHKKIVDEIADPMFSALTASPLASVSAKVTNTGKVTSDTVVLAYAVGPTPGKNGNPIKSLFGFQRIFALTPGQSSTVTFPVTAEDLSIMNFDGDFEATAGTWKIVVEDIAREIHVV